MLFSLMSLLAVFFFVTIAMGACVVVGSLLFDLVPVLRHGDDRLRQPLVFPQVSDRPSVRMPANVRRLAAWERVPFCPMPLRAAA